MRLLLALCGAAACAPEQGVFLAPIFYGTALCGGLAAAAVLLFIYQAGTERDTLIYSKFVSGKSK